MKVLDFGLAKLAAPAEAGAVAADTKSPTLSVQATVAGVILGTAAYMSPEQARGKPVDRRTDVWAFGCVLFEMLTGKRAFDGEQITDVLARILEREPDFDALPAATPLVIRKLLRRCLEKDRKRRLPDIGVARLEIEEAVAAPADENHVAAHGSARPATRLRDRLLPWSVAAAAGAILAVGTILPLWAPWRPVPSPGPQRLSVELGADVPLLRDPAPAAILSPDGRTLAFVATPGANPEREFSALYVRDLDQLQAHMLAGTTGAHRPFFSPDGQGVLADAGSGGAQFAASKDGTLVYVPGEQIPSGVDPIFWMDRNGKTSVLRATPAHWSNPEFSPDGRLLAIDIAAPGQSTDVWIYDWMRDTLSRLTFDPAPDEYPVWTPNGSRIVFHSQRGGNVFNLYWQRADGTGEVQRLTESQNSQRPNSWHPSGKFLAFVETSSQTSDDVMILPVEGDEASGWKPGKPTAFLKSVAQEYVPAFSPDGRWLAYLSNESGAVEVYVRPFPGPGGKWQISAGGGRPTWSRTRPELFYTAPDGRVMVVPYTVEGHSFRPDKPRPLAETRTMTRPRARSYALHPDGARFAMAPVREEATARLDNVVFIFNFFDELRRIAPTTNR